MSPADNPTLEELFIELTTCLRMQGGDDERAEQAAKALAQFGESALPGLQALLASPVEDDRWWAVRTLAEIDHESREKGEKHESVLDLLIGAAADESADVRQAAFLGLRLHPDPAAIAVLITALADPDSLCASMAADALVAIGSEAVPALLEVVEVGSQPARLEAVRALAEIKDPRAIQTLIAVLDEDSALLEYWASQGLEDMGVGTAFFLP